MTTPWRATPVQWANQERLASPPHEEYYAVCLLELRDRVNDLSQQITELQALRGTAVYWHRQHDLRLKGLEATHHAHIDTSQLSDEKRRAVVKDLSMPGRFQPLRTEITYGEANAHARRLVRHLSMGQPSYSTRLHSHSVGNAKPLEEWGKGHILAEPAPADCLVQRVKERIIAGCGNTWEETSADVLKEVASWLFTTGDKWSVEPDGWYRAADAILTEVTDK